MTINNVRVKIATETGFKILYPETSPDSILLPNTKTFQSYMDNSSQVKVEDGAVLYKDVATGEWLKVTNVSSKGTGLKIGNVINLSVKSENEKATIKWSDPTDIITTTGGVPVTLSEWGGTKLVYKTGSYPVSVEDGTLLVDNKVRDAYGVNGFELPNLTVGETYYFMLFPYNKHELVTESEVNGGQVNVTLIVDGSGSPGSGSLIGGTVSAGYFGIVPSSELITGDALAAQIGITTGTSQNNNESWLKFIIDGNIIFVAKKSFRHSISWDQIDAIGAVTGIKTVTIGGKTYKVRLMRGALTNPAKSTDVDKGAIGSEWNRLMLPIHINAPNNWSSPAWGGVSEDWGVDFTDDELAPIGNGMYTWCQETPTATPTHRSIRGPGDGSRADWSSSSVINSNYGWRPVLELIAPGEDTSGSPGATKTIAGGSEAGYFGVVPSNELITGDALASELGISQGIAQHSEAGWLKFIIDGKIIFVAKKTIRHTISWTTIDNAGAALGSRTVVIEGKTYKVRLMKGALTNPSDDVPSHRGAIGSEWNRLMLPIHKNAPNKWVYPATGGVSEDWGIKFTDNDLLTNNDAGTGSYTWCQERLTSLVNNRVFRGNLSIEHSNSHVHSTLLVFYGWRPVLELVVPTEDTSGSPGATKTLAGGPDAGYFGVVPSSELITGDALAAKVGVTGGTSQHSDVGWLKFIIDSKIIFVAKKPIRHTITWDHINSRNAVMGNRTIRIGDDTYRVRLMKGAKTNPFYKGGDTGTIGSEWNRLMLPIHMEAPNNLTYPAYAGGTEDWRIKFTDADLLTHSNAGLGSRTWCQETLASDLTFRSMRGLMGVSYATYYGTSTAIDASFGWRPVLEFVPPTEDIYGSPGVKKTIAGTSDAGYFGEVASSELITGDALATQVGITAGTSQYSTAGWLKFIIDGRIIFVAKKPVRNSISWNAINTVGAVLGTKTTVIDGRTYRVRLMKGAATNPSKDTVADKGAIGSEWNRLMLPIHDNASNNWDTPAHGGVTDDWGIKLTSIDLATSEYSWCQETIGSDSAARLIRGSDIDYSTQAPSSNVLSFYQWRPVLELILPGEDKSGSPGATKTIAGSSDAGYFGVVPSSELISGNALATELNVGAGSQQHSEEGWLKFIIDGKIIFVAKKPIRNNISWDSINGVGAAFGTKTIAIKGKTYKVRLLKGGLTNPFKSSDPDSGTLGSEWNRLMLPIHVNAPNKWVYPESGGISEDWGIKFTNADLLTHYTNGNGAYSWCQETAASSSSARMIRGNAGVESPTWAVASSVSAIYGWRPVLELV